MKKLSILTVFLLLIIGCSNSPSNETFNVGFSVSTLTPKVDEEFIMSGILANRTKHTYQLHHADGVFDFYIADSEGKNIHLFETDTVSKETKLKGETAIPEEYKYIFKQSGTYKVWAVANFSVGNDDKQYELKSEVMNIEVNH